MILEPLFRPKTSKLCGLLLAILFFASFLQISMSILSASGASQTVTLTIKYSVVGQSSAAGYPTFSYTINGQATSVVLKNPSTVLSADNGSTWSISSQLPGSDVSTRWATPVASGVVGASQISVTYYLQYLVVLGFSSVGGTHSPPTVDVMQFGSTSQVVAGGPVWLDEKSPYAYPTTLSGSNSNERWNVPSAISGLVTGPTNVTATYFHQFWVTGSYSVMGGGQVAPPSLTSTAFGSATSLVLSSTPQSIWLDSGQPYGVPLALGGGAVGERWTCGQSPTGTVTKSFTLNLVYYHQYSLEANYAVIGGAAPTIIPLQGTSLGSMTSFTLGTNPRTIWLDVGSSYSTPGVLQASQSERWFASGPTSGVLSSPATLVVTYYHQFGYAMAYTVTGATPSSPPQLSFTSLGSATSVTLGKTSQYLWLDAGTSYSADATLSPSSSSERWETQSPSGTASAGGSVTFIYYHQFSISFSLQWAGAIPSNVPSVDVYSYGALHGVSLSQGATVWADEGSTWTAQALIAGQQGQRWALSGASSGIVSGSLASSLSYTEQFSVSLAAVPGIGGSVQPLAGWYDYGSVIHLGAFSVNGWKFIGWEGSGNSSYTGNNTATTLTLESPVNESASFYPGVTIAATSGGAVSYAADGQVGQVSGGRQVTVYIPEGSQVTLKAVPSSVLEVFSHWAGAATGPNDPLTFSAGGSMSITAVFGENLALRYILSAVIAGVVILMVAYVVLRHELPFQKRLSGLARKARAPWSRIES